MRKRDVVGLIAWRSMRVNFAFNTKFYSGLIGMGQYDGQQSFVDEIYRNGV